MTPEKEKPEIPGQRKFGGAHLLQSLLAGGFIFFAFLAVEAFHNRMAVASLGASAFIAFAFPHTQSSRARFLIGGYCVGAASGLACYFLIRWLDKAAFFPFDAYVPGCAVAVFLSMLLMTSLNLEHPPSAALSIAVATAEYPVRLGLAAVVCVVALAGLRRLLRKWLYNL